MTMSYPAPHREPFEGFAELAWTEAKKDALFELFDPFVPYAILVRGKARREDFAETNRAANNLLSAFTLGELTLDDLATMLRILGVRWVSVRGIPPSPFTLNGTRWWDAYFNAEERAAIKTAIKS